MKNTVKIAVVAIAAQVCLAAGVSAGTAAQPLVVDMAVNVAVDAPTGGLSDAAEAISAAAASGDNYKAQELLSGLFSGGLKAGKTVPVHADKCCHCCVSHCPAGPAAAEPAAVSTSAAPAAAPVVYAPLSYPDPAAELAEAAAAKAEAAKEAAKKEKEEEQKQKGFAWGVTIMTVALIFLIILL